MKKFRQKDSISSTMDIAPLIDVIFILLLFFILTSKFFTPGIKLNLPEAGNKEVIKEEKLIVSVDKREIIYINGKEVSLENLKSNLKDMLKDSSNQKVIFKGDETIIYKKFIKVLDAIKESGAKEVSIAHKKNI